MAVTLVATLKYDDLQSLNRVPNRSAYVHQRISCYGGSNDSDMCVVFESTQKHTLCEPSERIKKKINKLIDCPLRKKLI
jgi:hypothetical protein